MVPMIDIRPGSNPQRIAGSDVPVIFGPGSICRVGAACRELGASRVLLVTDPGIRSAGHVDRALASLQHAGLIARTYDHADPNPTTETVDHALAVAREFHPDLIVGLGGGSSMDTAKGVNFLYTNGGRMSDYWGTGKAGLPMLPMIAIPTTAGTGSEAQSYALISDAATHAKMACGDKKALPRLAILDPDLVATVPPATAAATGIDAIAHAVETSACTKRNDLSRPLSQGAWQLLESSFMTAPGMGHSALSSMLLGAHLAGCAIENSMLGAAHATANPLTARFGITHGVAVGLMLPHVVRFNSSDGENPYSDLDDDPNRLADRLDQLLAAARLPRRLRDIQVPEQALPELSRLSGRQWTAAFNPRPVGEKELLAIYQTAF